MEILAIALLVIISIYPYFLLLRLMRLACKALKKYISEQPNKADYRFAEE